MSADLIPRAIQVNLHAEYENEQELEHVFVCRAEHDPVTYADCFACLDPVYNFVINKYQALCNDAVHFTRITATAIDNIDGPFAEMGLDLQGTRAGTAVAGNETKALKKSTHLKGRSQRGDIFSFPMVEADIIGQHFDATYITDLLAGFNDLIGSFGTAGQPLCVPSYVRQRLENVESFVAVTNYVDSRRRRLSGRGA